MTRIKEFRHTSINLEEIECKEYTWISVAIWITIFLVGTAVGWSMTLINPLPADAAISFVPVFSAAIGLAVFLVFGGLIGVGTFSHPGYRVYIPFVHDGNSEIEIKHTTDEEDQKAICKAAQDLEPKALEYDKQQNKIIELARGCK